ncbi:hypothetical protein [Allosphingosinicella sp.]|uniref:hypothetical protein n=1 Tax=Allosphingosinicella sp. TaxID=2823234 RepID=UPI002EF2DFD2
MKKDRRRERRLNWREMMTHNLLRAGSLSCALLASTCLTAPAAAQTVAEFRHVDSNGVDLVQGDFVMSFTEGSIGSGSAALPLVRESGNSAASQYDGITFRRTVSGSTATIDVGLPGRERDRFTGSAGGSTFTAVAASGATLEKSGFGYVYRGRDGTYISFFDPTGAEEAGNPPTSFCAGTSQAQCDMLPQFLTSPNGRMITFTWELYAMPDGSGGTSYEHRLTRVANSHDYAIGFAYQDDSQSWGTPPSSGWRTRSEARFFNDSVSTTTPQASVSYSYPSAGTIDVTDMAGKVWRVTATSIRRPGETNASFSVGGSVGAVTSITREE